MKLPKKKYPSFFKNHRESKRPRIPYHDVKRKNVKDIWDLSHLQTL